MILLRIKDAFLKNTKKVFLLKFLFVTDLHDLFVSCETTKSLCLNWLEFIA